MLDELKSFLSALRSASVARIEPVTIDSWGRSRTFVAYDHGEDTFVFEEGIWETLENKDPVIVTPKAAISPGAAGFVMTVSSGNHAVASLPLLGGRFWDLGTVPVESRGQVLAEQFVCLNCVEGSFELSQRGTSTALVTQVDAWLQAYGWPMNRIVIVDRVDETLQFYRVRGQEWRIKPLAWTEAEMTVALRSSQGRIHTSTRYFHNVKGVHFITLPRLRHIGELIESNYEEFVICLNELAGRPGDSRCSFLRSKKYHAHHEIELFGLRQGVDSEQLLADLEALVCRVNGHQDSRAEIGRAFGRIADAYEGYLWEPALGDESSRVFVETMYKHLTGEIYLGSPDEIAPAFDDRKTAMPGATFDHGKPYLHPGADERTEAILEYVERTVSHGESIEYVNVYEIRSTDGVILGEGRTREIVFKTNLRPLPHRLIEKRLAQKSTGYGNYTLARVKAFRALGISYGPHYLLARNDQDVGEVHYYIRERYPGEPFDAIPRSYYLLAGGSRASNGDRHEDPEVIRVVAALLGEAAAENMVLKKYIPEARANRFGVGKEIVEFGYDIHRGRVLPLKIRLCSVRGTLGWPSTTCDESNLRALFDYYTVSYANGLYAFYEAHGAAASLKELLEAFLEGFSTKTREICWNYVGRRECFDEYRPSIRRVYHFPQKWRFALWALEQQHARLQDVCALISAQVHDLDVAPRRG